MLGPHGAYLLIRSEFSSRGGLLRSSNGSMFVGRQYDDTRRLAPCQLHHEAGNLILAVGWQSTHRFDGLIEKLCHSEKIG